MAENELSLNTIVISALVVLTLIVLSVIFIRTSQDLDDRHNRHNINCKEIALSDWGLGDIEYCVLEDNRCDCFKELKYKECDTKVIWKNSSYIEEKDSTCELHNSNIDRARIIEEMGARTPDFTFMLRVEE